VGWEAGVERRSFLMGGAAVSAAALAGRSGLDRLDRLGSLVPEPRSDRPHGGHTGALGTRVVWHAAPEARRVALTFDDGPDPRWTPLVLALLARHHVPATFYVVGKRADRHLDLLRRTAAEGHEIGNHTWSHADLCRAAPDVVREELVRTAELVERSTGVAPASVRPPWGHVDAVGLLAAAELGCDVVLWSELVRAGAAESDLAASLRDVRPGSVVLAHDGGPTPTTGELDAVERLVVGLQEDGYAFTTVAALLRDDPVALPVQRTQA
jgi:peptidoglycan/xylan/chitin deacetylase (PgdA/CDA1 family)